jgi:hypothetical protein
VEIKLCWNYNRTKACTLLPAAYLIHICALSHTEESRTVFFMKPLELILIAPSKLLHSVVFAEFMGRYSG